MSGFLARTGRHRQRYDENNFRLVSGCIPYRLTEEEKDVDGESRIEVLMISSPNRSDLVFPKGGWEDDETVAEAARREALEEAGVRGILREIPLGVWEFRSKSRQDLCTLEGSCRGFMFALEVTEELDIWPEQKDRDRIWLNAKEAFRLCRYDWMRRALEEFLRVMAEDEELKLEEEEEEEELVEPPSIPVSDVVADCQVMAANCYVKPSNAQHHHGLSAISSPWHIPLKRLPLT
ncbi:nudix hydrolase 12, mitochondrial [Herrania umbratica]|uniref:Nudix hydrolase 12, mitochondrial n=1 Tax=Herrania umbratica TaxID=108875 RepID=A0A6J1BFK4_9ROSI|nr:nudix hydrolase 12, mitochondrial [Herrania umbratica]XP_021297894.1 nudix hydrolase 12, mitochondrial [Herrania umbratica]XP_021297895.1 nudix hydrolase 12, mitochondrial [Herrania umbratica]